MSYSLPREQAGALAGRSDRVPCRKPLRPHARRAVDPARQLTAILTGAEREYGVVVTWAAVRDWLSRPGVARQLAPLFRLDPTCAESLCELLRMDGVSSPSTIVADGIRTDGA